MHAERHRADPSLLSVQFEPQVSHAWSPDENGGRASEAEVAAHRAVCGVCCPRATVSHANVAVTDDRLGSPRAC